MINMLEQIVPLPVGSELLQEASDAFSLLANANTELNQSLTYIVIICTNIPHPSHANHRLTVWEWFTKAGKVLDSSQPCWKQCQHKKWANCLIPYCD